MFKKSAYKTTDIFPMPVLYFTIPLLCKAVRVTAKTGTS